MKDGFDGAGTRGLQDPGEGAGAPRSQGLLVGDGGAVAWGSKGGSSVARPRAGLGGVAGAAFVAALLAGVSAEAAEVTRATERRPGERPDVSLGLTWTSDLKSSSVRREVANASGRSLVNDLRYRQSRHVLTLQAEVGLWRDLSLLATAPFVVGDDRTLSFDRRDCAAGQLCVDENRSSFLRDGILPGAGMAMFGWDAQRGRAFQRPATDLFRGASRRGLESLGLGLSWRVFDEVRTPALPTWLVRLESRFAVTEEMRFDLSGRGGNQAVGPGHHTVIAASAFSRRLGWAEPYVAATYLFPVAKGGSVFKRYNLGDGNFSRPQQRAQLEAGVELVAWEEPAAQQRVAFELRGRGEARFAGLARTELWEPLSGSSSCETQPAMCRSGIDRDFDGDGTVDPHPGVVRSPAYGVYGGDLGVDVRVGPHVRFRGLAGLGFEQPHALTDGRSRDVVIDAPGRRFRIEDAKVWTIFVDGGLSF